jgi:HD-GYP domain-containing protein (c-di-GMP phosphodiesterase class II)
MSKSQSRITLAGISPQLETLKWNSERLMRIGRLDSLEIVLQDASISRRHAEVFPSGNGWAIHDLGSSNGTFLNGVRLGRNSHPLRENDLIRCGNLLLKVAELQEESSVLMPSAQIDQSHGTPHLKTSGCFLKVQATSQRPWGEAMESLAAQDDQQLWLNKHMLAMLRTGYNLCQIKSLSQLLRSILEDAVGVLDAQRGAIVLADEATGHLHLHAVVPDSSIYAQERKFSKTLAQRVFNYGYSLLCRDVDSDAELRAMKSSSDNSMASVICVLLRTPRRRLGVLHLDRGPRQPAFTSEDFYLADAIAASVSVGIECAHLAEQQQIITSQAVSALAQAVEVRDHYTAGHTQRVTSYAMMLAQELKLSPSELHQIEIGTPLHDIGKIGIDDSILRKPGRLTTDEFDLMKLHTVKGAAILESIPNLSSLVPIVRHHHERWDGTGYPDGLTGSGISRLARVVAVADSLDAMTSDRPYRRAFTLDRALAEIRHNAGRTFDPECVQVLLSLRPQIESMLTQENSLKSQSESAPVTFTRDELVRVLKEANLLVQSNFTAK